MQSVQADARQVSDGIWKQHCFNQLSTSTATAATGRSDRERRRRRVRHVTFSSIVTVVTADQNDRTSPWCQAAIDRMRFRRRIALSEQLLKPILTEQHRNAMRMYRVRLS